MKMTITDIIFIKKVNGNRLALCGRVEDGPISIGDKISIINQQGVELVTGVEIVFLEIGFSKGRFTTVEEGMNAALEISADHVDRNAFKVGDVVVKEGR